MLQTQHKEKKWLESILIAFYNFLIKFLYQLNLDEQRKIY